MCRFLVYKGSDEILLSKLILDPTHSILTQSFDARLRLDHGRNNADGFGVAFYTDPHLGPEPCIFTSTTPAWNCVNLHRLASKTASRLIFAHVRATTQGSLSEDNCHPFTHASFTWMHNGGLGAWKYIKRNLGAKLSDEWYLGVQGGTDSEWAFALFLDTLQRMGFDPSCTPEDGFGPNVIRKAMLKTIAQINDLIASIPETMVQEQQIDTRSLMNFAVTDGHSVVCTRYVSSTTDEAASLYYSSGTTWHDEKKGNFQMDRRDKGGDIVLVASEPLTFERDNWVTVPTNSTLTIHKQTVMVHPIIDQYYSHNPYHHRSSRYVVEKGLVTNEKQAPTAHVPSPVPTSVQTFDLHTSLRQALPPSKLQESISRSLTPEPAQSPISRTTSSFSSQSMATQPHRLQSEEVPDAGTFTNCTTPSMLSLSLQQTQSMVRNEGSRVQEMTNTKKKRKSLDASSSLSARISNSNGSITAGTVADGPAEDEERQSNFGDPAKIAQYFPELNLSA